LGYVTSTLHVLGCYEVWLAQGVGNVVFSNNACVITMYRTGIQELKIHHVALF